MPQAYKGVLLGAFNEYKKDPDDPNYIEGSYFCKNAKGADLYSLRNTFDSGLYVMTEPNSDLIIASAAHPFIPIPRNGQRVWHIPGLRSVDERAVLGGTISA